MSHVKGKDILYYENLESNIAGKNLKFTLE